MLAGMIADARSAGVVFSPQHDSYGRSLAVLVLNGADVGPHLIAIGLVRRYDTGR